MADSLVTAEVRKDKAGRLDEILLYADGKCLMHLERMDKTHVWFVLHTDAADRHFRLTTWKDTIALREDADGQPA